MKKCGNAALMVEGEPWQRLQPHNEPCINLAPALAVECLAPEPHKTSLARFPLSLSKPLLVHWREGLCCKRLGRGKFQL